MLSIVQGDFSSLMVFMSRTIITLFVYSQIFKRKAALKVYISKTTLSSAPLQFWKGLILMSSVLVASCLTRVEGFSLCMASFFEAFF